MNRATWDETWMDVADTIARRSACLRDQVGAVIVGPSNRIISTGYNGPPQGFQGSCLMCPRQQLGPPRPCISAHAEANAIAWADRGRYTGGTLYVTSTVCQTCAPLVANCGVSRVVGRWDAIAHAHRDPEFSKDLLIVSGLEVVTWNR